MGTSTIGTTIQELVGDGIHEETTTTGSKSHMAIMATEMDGIIEETIIIGIRVRMVTDKDGIHGGISTTGDSGRYISG